MVMRSGGGGVGSCTMSLTTAAVNGKDALIVGRRARTGRPSTASAVNAPTDGACSVATSEPYVALLGMSPVGSTFAPARPLNVIAASHISFALGLPSSCNPLPGGAGPVVEGSPVVGPVGPIAIDCFRAGATGSALVYIGSAGGAIGSPTRLSSLAADGCSSYVDSVLQQATIN